MTDDEKLLQEILRETEHRDTPTETPPPENNNPSPSPDYPPYDDYNPQHDMDFDPEPDFDPDPFPDIGMPEDDAPTSPPSHTAEWTRQTAQQYNTPPPMEDDDLDGESVPPPSRAQQNQTRKKRRGSHHQAIWTIILTIVILGLSVILSVVMIIYGRDMLGISNDTSTKMITIPQGADMTEIAEILEDEGIINRAGFFVIIAGMSDKDTEIMPGDHELRPDMAYETILDELTSPPLDGTVSVSVTFPEGIRLVDAAELLEENNVCNADEFLTYFNNNATFGYAYEDYLPRFRDRKFYYMEGYLFPDTYTFYQDMSVELVCQKILTNFNTKIKPEYYDRMEALGMTLDETLTLASIIQCEAGSIDQMADISSVFWNRLNDATEYPLLQSDVTYFYVEEVIKPHSETYNQDLYDTYDTYTCMGLPAGPICNPGEDAIIAALYPNNTNYYYFYADEQTGETYFATTLEEHNANQEMVAALHENDED